MFTIIKTATSYVTISVPLELRYHQFTIKPDPIATTGDFVFHTLVDGSYVQLQGVDVSLELLRPATIEGIFYGFMIEAENYDGTTFTVEYIGE